MGEQQILAAQRGLITRQQALHVGMTNTTIGRRLRTKMWRRMFPGVYRHVAATVDDQLMAEAALLWLGASAVLSGSWAAWWHDLRSEPDGPVSVTVPLGASNRQHRHVDLRRRDLRPADVVRHRGLQVTSRPLTVLENAALPGGQDVIDRALQQHLSVATLDRAMTGFVHATGATAARRALQLAAEGTVSPPERRLSAALKRAGLTDVKAGVHVVADGVACWLDFAVAELKLAIEVDGYLAHSSPEAFRKDRHRQNALVRDGWTVLRFTAQQIRDDIDAVISEIRATIRRIVENFDR